MNLQYQMKTMLNEKAALLQKHDAEFFRKKVRNHNADTIKSKRETREIFTDSKKSFPWSPSYPLRRSEGQKRVEDRITENSIMVAAGFINRHKKSAKIWVW